MIFDFKSEDATTKIHVFIHPFLRHKLAIMENLGWSEDEVKRALREDRLASSRTATLKDQEKYVKVVILIVTEFISIQHLLMILKVVMGRIMI